MKIMNSVLGEKGKNERNEQNEQITNNNETQFEMTSTFNFQSSLILVQYAYTVLSTEYSSQYRTQWPYCYNTSHNVILMRVCILLHTPHGS